jgi:cellulose biosynthesis protein BcsQ
MGDALDPIVDQLIQFLVGGGVADWTVKVAAAVLLGLAVIGLRKLYRVAAPWFRTLISNSKKIDRAMQAISPHGRGLWLASSIKLEPPNGYKAALRRSIPIIVVANLKGGVGKTTVAANLIGHYANKKGERVLAIDLDFQGSLTATAMSAHERDQMLEVEAEGVLSKAAHLIESGDAFWLQHATAGVADVPNARLIPTYYSLASVENRVMVEWLIGMRPQDVRYNLARALLSDEIQSRYSRVIIDAPPRLTTGCVQALAAATHVLVPTILDDMSAEAVGAFANQLRVNQAIWPNLKLLGAVGTMTTFNPAPNGILKEDALTQFELDAVVSIRDALNLALQSAHKPLVDTGIFPIECFIPNKAELGRAAGHRIAYASSANTSALREIREAFDRLGDEIDRRIAISRSGVAC